MLSLREWEQKFVSGEFNKSDFDTMCKFGWYDWFYNNKAILPKSKQLGKKVLQIINSSKIDKDNMCVFFKNNCPMLGNLYDDFRICDMKTGDVLYTIIPKSGYYSEKHLYKEGKIKGLASVYGIKEDGKFGLMIKGSWNDVKKWFNQ